jgi:hypothetical protein
MSGRMKKCIDITPNGVLHPGSPQDYLWLRAQSWWEEILVDTRYIRFWVDWPSLQPDAAYALGSAPSESLEAFRLVNLDAQIRAANLDGLNVILLPYRYPQWANGTAQLVVGSLEDRLFEPENRVRGSSYLPWFYDRTRALPSVKDLRYRLPPDGHGPDSSWGRWVRAIFERWLADSDIHGRADVIEVCNEPNLQLWPQRGPSADTSTIEGRFEVVPGPSFRVNPTPTSEMTVHRAVAEMMHTVAGYARAYHPKVRCFAPSTSDSDISATSAYRSSSKFAATPYSATLSDPFVPRLLDELDRTRFKGGPRWRWSFHNYNDWEQALDRVSYLRALLAGRWRGKTDDAGDPVLAATEGGCRLSRVPDRFPGLPPGEVLAKQAAIISEGIQRFAAEDGVGAGVRLLTQYTVCADPNFDTGLREPDGTTRPAWDAWCAKLLRQRPATEAELSGV